MTITPVKTMVRDAKSRITSLSVEEARKQAEAGEALLLDIRDIRELDREGRVPGAYHAPRGMLEFWIDPESPYHKPALLAEGKRLVLFCASSWRSALAADTLRGMGVENVAEIEGGFNAWRDQGAPVEKA